jgi:citrate lyase subunit beta/citryl-CoA lyase
MRSLLFLPGDSERKLEKGFGSQADILLIDLEDSVALANKARAREIAAAAIAERRGGAPGRIFVRVNDFSTGLIDDDLAAIIPARPAGIMLPKAVGLPDIERLSTRLRVHEATAGLEDGSVRILPIMTENPAGFFAAATFQAGHARLSGLTWGAEDLSASIGARAVRDGAGRYTDIFRLARAATVLAASAAEVAAIDTVFVNFRDLAGLRAECVEAERDGFVGKLAIHPDQVAVINEVFTPSAEAVAEARAVIDAFVAAGNPGVVGIDGRMYDRPHLRRAERLLARV